MDHAHFSFRCKQVSLINGEVSVVSVQNECLDSYHAVFNQLGNDLIVGRLWYLRDCGFEA